MDKINYFVTNLQNKGLISADRGTKATLMLTIPCSIFKSFTKDLSFPIFELVIQHRSHSSFYESRAVYNVMILDLPENRPILTHYNIREELHIATFQHGFWLRGVQP